MQLISLPIRLVEMVDDTVAATSPGLDIPSGGKLSSASLQQLDNLENRHMMKIW